MKQIPVYAPLLDGNELTYLADCIRSGWISADGPFVQRFEERFSSSVKRRFGVSVTNGTAALEVAFRMLRVGPGDEVIVPAFCIISCVAAVLRCGATPVLVDVDPTSWNMRLDHVAARITSKTKAILVVHTYGLPADIVALCELAERHDIAIVEDAAEAHGATIAGRPCGSFGKISVFSFYSNKTVTTGEGGMVLTDESELAERARSLRNLCFGSGNRFRHDELGNNFRMCSLQAAVGLAQLERLEEFIAIKKRNAAVYRSRLCSVESLELPLASTGAAENVYWIFGVLVCAGARRAAAEIRKRLGDRGIGVRPFFWPMHEQPALINEGLFRGESYPVSESLARRGMYLPMGLDLTAEQIHYVCDAVEELLR